MLYRVWLRGTVHASGQGNGLPHGTGADGAGSGARGPGVGPCGVSGTQGGMGMMRPCGCGVGRGGSRRRGGGGADGGVVDGGVTDGSGVDGADSDGALALGDVMPGGVASRPLSLVPVHPATVTRASKAANPALGTPERRFLMSL